MGDTGARPLSGLLTAILTPFDVRGELALSQVPVLIEFQRAAGVDGLVVCGTNGEGVSLSADERMRLLEAVIAHRGSLTIVAATGAASVTDAVALTRHASACGADALLALPPFFFKAPASEGLQSYFRSVLDASDVPVLLYNIPQITMVPISHPLLDALLDHRMLAGVKDSTGDWTSTKEYIDRYPSLRIFGGSDRLAQQCYVSGAAGCISGGANAFPEVVAAVRDAARSGAAGDEARARLNALLDITTRYPFISSSKSILVMRGMPRLGVRPPLVPLSVDQEAALRSELESGEYL